MVQPSTFQNEVYAGLRACLDLSFPRICQSCGTVYLNLEDFVANTEELDRQHGLMDYKGRAQQRTIVGLYRNCHCHTTLMAVCEDRRDTSPKGIQRRQKFAALLVLLEEKGVARDAARKSLLKMLRGQKTRTLEKLGINQETFNQQLPQNPT